MFIFEPKSIIKTKYEIMKKRKAALIILALVYLNILGFAQTNIIVISNDLSEAEYPISNIQKITFNGYDMTIHKKDNNNTGHYLYNTKKIVFDTNGLNPINETERNNIFAYPNPVVNSLYIRGLTKYKSIKLFSLQGIELPVICTNYNNKIDIDVSYLTKGTYLILIDKQTIKFTKK